MYKILILSILVFASLFLLQSCNNDIVNTQEETSTLLFSKSGLVDSAYVTCCCLGITRFFSDTLDLSRYNKIRVEFNGFSNSDGSEINVSYITNSNITTQVFSIRNQTLLNGNHSFAFSKPADTLYLELRNIIYPPICGTFEFKYTRCRDFSIYGVK